MANEQIHVLQEEITVTHDGETYVFKLPSVRDDAKVGSYARYLRAQDDPEGIGSADGLDFNSFYIYQALATFHVLLRRATVDWPFSPSEKGLPVVDVNKFPESAPVMEVYDSYLKAVSEFRGKTNPRKSAGEDAVASEPDTQS